jgi:predicted transcriptional regulator YdeE
MKSFIAFIRESELADVIVRLDAHRAKLAKLPADKHIEKLDKTAHTIRNHVMSGGNTNHARAHELISRYDSHYEALKDNHPEAHRAWLKSRGAVSHSGFDLYA